MFTIHAAPQRSDAWRLARAGRLTASVAGEMLATVKNGGEAAGRRNLRTRLVLERLTGKPQEREFDNAHMERGRELEPLIADRYEQEQGVLLTHVGLLVHPTLMAGASPDGLVLRDAGLVEGVVEIKSRIPALHLEALTRGIPAKALPQLTHLMWLIDSAAWVDYVSYCADFPEALQFHRMRLTRADFAGDLALYGEAVETFLAEVDAEVEKIGGLLAAKVAHAE